MLVRYESKGIMRERTNLQTPDFTRCPVAQIITGKDRKWSGWVNDVPDRSLGRCACSQLTSNKLDENGSAMEWELMRGCQDDGRGCQEIGFVGIMFFFELLFLCFFTISLYVFLTNLFSIVHSLICQSPERLKKKEKQEFDSTNTG